MTKALAQYHDATGDTRVLDVLTRYFRYQLAALPLRPLEDWGKYRAQDQVLVVQCCLTVQIRTFYWNLQSFARKARLDRCFPIPSCTQESRRDVRLTKRHGMAAALRKCIRMASTMGKHSNSVRFSTASMVIVSENSTTPAINSPNSTATSILSGETRGPFRLRERLVNRP